MTRATLAACVALLLALPLRAAACGACIEDTIAVTYDHAVVEAAAARGHVVVFASIATRAMSQAAFRSVEAAASRVRGVDRATVRVAAEPAALSFALDPGVQSPAAALAAIEKSTAPAGMRLTLLRVVR